MVATANTGGAASRFDRSNPAHHDMGRPECPRDTCPGFSMTDTGNGWRRPISARSAPGHDVSGSLVCRSRRRNIIVVNYWIAGYIRI
jgi:hypothetical protein